MVLKKNLLQIMECLTLPETQFEDLNGIVSLSISNLLSEDGKHKPHLPGVLEAAEMATKVPLKGSDHVNLLPQARALLLRSPIGPFVTERVEGGPFDGIVEVEGETPGLDIAKIVKIGYPKGDLLSPRGLVSSSEDIKRSMKSIDLAFKSPKVYYPDEKVGMVQHFQCAIQGLHIAELMIHSHEFKIDSVVFGLGEMSFAERLLRKRINEYMEGLLMKFMKREDNPENIKHIETTSLPLELKERTEYCIRLDNKYGGGAMRKSGVLFFGSGSAGETYYDAMSDYFPLTITKFYQEHFGTLDVE